jgi:hypothetical protein
MEAAASQWAGRRRIAPPRRRSAAPPAIRSATRRSAAVTWLPDRSAAARGGSRSIWASSGRCPIASASSCARISASRADRRALRHRPVRPSTSVLRASSGRSGDDPCAATAARAESPLPPGHRPPRRSGLDPVRIAGQGGRSAAYPAHGARPRSAGRRRSGRPRRTPRPAECQGGCAQLRLPGRGP